MFLRTPLTNGQVLHRGHTEKQLFDSQLTTVSLKHFTLLWATTAATTTPVQVTLESVVGPSLNIFYFEFKKRHNKIGQ